MKKNKSNSKAGAKTEPKQPKVHQTRAEKKSEKKAEKVVRELEKKAGIKSPKKKISKTRRVIDVVLLVIVVILLGAGVCVTVWGNEIIAKITGGNGNILDALVFLNETYDPLKMDENGRTNILAFGTSGFDMDGTEYGGGTHDGADLTDSIMVISVDQNAGDVAMLSLPRDLKASATCTATGKINEIYWCNSYYYDDEKEAELNGATALMDEVGSILGIDIHYYIHVNWGSLSTIVDALGGITVTLDEDIYDYDYTGAVYIAGEAYSLNGEEALGLARARHGTTGGDFSRGNSQQKILIGIKDKIYENNVSLTNMVGIVSTLGDNLRTNLTLSEIKTGAHLTFEFDFDNIRQVPLVDYNENIYYFTTANINGISYVIPRAGVGNYSSIQEYVAEQFTTPVVEEVVEEGEETTEETTEE